MKRIKKLFFFLTIIVVFVFFVWVIKNWKHISTFPEIISAWYAKEFCSCYYVLEKDENFCHNLVRQWVSISDFRLLEKEKRIIVSGLGRTNSAKYISKKFGCRLE